MRVNSIYSPQTSRFIADNNGTPREIEKPLSKVYGITSLKEKAHQAEVDANLWAAHMKHQRRLLEILITGHNYS